MSAPVCSRNWSPGTASSSIKIGKSSNQFTHTNDTPASQSQKKLRQIDIKVSPLFGVLQTLDSSFRSSRRALACICCSWLANWPTESACAGPASCQDPKTLGQCQGWPMWQGRRNHHQVATHWTVSHFTIRECLNIHNLVSDWWISECVVVLRHFNSKR